MDIALKKQFFLDNHRVNELFIEQFMVELLKEETEQNIFYDSDDAYNDDISGKIPCKGFAIELDACQFDGDFLDVSDPSDITYKTILYVDNKSFFIGYSSVICHKEGIDQRLFFPENLDKLLILLEE